MAMQARTALTSLPARGGWIEIFLYAVVSVSNPSSLPARGGWIEIWRRGWKKMERPSLPARGGWIEIDYDSRLKAFVEVPPRTGRVD